MKSIGRRREGRLRTDLRAKAISLRYSQQAKLLDLSLNGAKIQAIMPLELNEQVMIFWLHREAVGNVAWVHEVPLA